MSELYANPDRETDAASLAQLHDALQHSFADPSDASVLEAQRSLFWRIIEDALDGQVDPLAEKALVAYGELVDYLWFRPVDAPLPPALVRINLYWNDDQQGRPEGYSELAFGLTHLGPTIFEHITEMFEGGRLDDLLRVRSLNVAKNGTFRQAIEIFASKTPAARWLREFSAQNSKTPSHLTAQERDNREALIFGAGAQTLRQRFGAATSAYMAVNPDVRRFIRSRTYPLDEEPGSRRVRPRGLQVPNRLAQFATRELVTRMPELAEATQVSYDLRQDRFEFAGKGGVISDDLEPADLGMLLHDVFGFAPTLGGDDISAEIFHEALRMAYASTAAGHGPPVDIYSTSIRIIAARYTQLLSRGWELLDANSVLTTVSILKHFSNDQPFGTPVDRDQDKDSHINFAVKSRKMPEPDSAEEAKDVELARMLRQGRVSRPTRARQVEVACRGLLQVARRLLLLPNDAPDEVLYKTLQSLGRRDPIVDCLGALYQAQTELSAGGNLSQPALAELRRQLAYATRLEALEVPEVPASGPDPYASPKEVGVALRRALQSVASLIEPPPDAS